MQIGDGGFILKLGDDVLTDASWKAKCFFFGPMEGEKELVKHVPIPEEWSASDFDDRDWGLVTVYEESVARPPSVFGDYDFKGAKFVWT